MTDIEKRRLPKHNTKGLLFNHEKFDTLINYKEKGMLDSNMNAFVDYICYKRQTFFILQQ